MIRFSAGVFLGVALTVAAVLFHDSTPTFAARPIVNRSNVTYTGQYLTEHFVARFDRLLKWTKREY